MFFNAFLLITLVSFAPFSVPMLVQCCSLIPVLSEVSTVLNSLNTLVHGKTSTLVMDINFVTPTYIVKVDCTK